MKSAEHPHVDGLTATGEGRTRVAVARMLMEQGPVTAGEIAAALEISGPAVRRHLDALLADGEAEAREAPARGRRGRGRPARSYLLTAAGRTRFGHGYDDLAVAALRYLAEQGGQEAVEGFARKRARDLIGSAAPAVGAVESPGDRADVLAGALTERGYAAQARAAGTGARTGVQLCQHHCPVAHVAAEFPALCEAETAAIADLLGTHVQRLATIARGDAACTTHVPLDVPDVARRPHPTTIPRGRQSTHDDRS
ncbi:helix-turn-helix transcriptional regulator [Pseudonocardia sp. CA-107938]|uniref:helix-turn-helix transcriptional regulator n=1 Tax=Pseudonocardia sp. CA-107938 TaxID=3240021 RepID=UPI003D946F55